MEKAIRLDASDEVLEYPNGDVEIITLEEILTEATIESIKKDQLVFITKEERAKNFDSEAPYWRRVSYKIPLSMLYKMYKDLTGENFRLKSYEEIQRKASRAYLND
nr:hypothetical protein [Candidatus Woesearchaeota archaeon]